MSALEDRLAFQLDAVRIPYERQVRFAPKRQYRADFGIELNGRRLLVEVEGGIFRGDVGHNSVGGIKRDIEKQALAVSLGWTVLRVHTDMVKDGTALRLIEEHLGLEVA